MGALLTVAVYITPFLLIGLAAKIWIKRKGVGGFLMAAAGRRAALARDWGAKH